ncbi:hypothetical protein HanRHA438_Chr06g0254851 [Helianthus annuus]|nr:hypothetical protein HanRHA438_Chr06g0254851 [Helianthus annuus]
MFFFAVNMDPYVILTFKTQEKKSTVASGTISLDALFREGDIPAKSYSVMKDNAHCGEIRIGLNFTAQKSRGFDPTDGNIGGWKQSGRD